jgi:hypothetical protein
MEAMRNPLNRNGDEHVESLRRRVTALENALFETRALNERVADVVDVVVELLVPAVDRDEAKLRELLQRLDPPKQG